ncbi:alpha/beta hydrolase [Hymenobacter sp. RP-2-7]|uniref:Alpha/beta hydrolase n=1 Tax=Hymenobacter polaris TaxID=2682546 RepID=A0A7Y0AAB8_9BACT|nr:alpha/beta hydrolase [Hymenobacter polaris]NML63696.1 alpha/beta hydrolase [Hymenobacter polaris]
MRTLLLTLALLAAGAAVPALAQAPAADTSFTLHSALRSARKQHPGVQLAQPAAPAGIRSRYGRPYCRVGQQVLHLDVFAPRARPPRAGYPAVLVVHGGGWRSGRPSQHWPLARQLAAQGFVVATAEYRLSGQAPYPAALLDLRAALRYLRAHARRLRLDTTRVAAWGFSAGGQLAALLATTGAGSAPAPDLACWPHHSSAVQALVDVDGILAFTHPESGEGDDSRGPSAATIWLGAPRAAQPAQWQQAGALSHVSAAAPPTLFLNSGVARMHAGRDDFTRQLDAYGIYHEAHTFADAPHVFPLLEPWFPAVLDYTVAFLRRVLPAPAR